MGVRQKWTHWGLNPGPSACEADVISLHHAPNEIYRRMPFILLVCLGRHADLRAELRQKQHPNKTGRNTNTSNIRFCWGGHNLKHSFSQNPRKQSQLSQFDKMSAPPRPAKSPDGERATGGTTSGDTPARAQHQGMPGKCEFMKARVSTKTPETKTARNGAKVENQVFRKTTGEAKTQATTGYF